MPMSLFCGSGVALVTPFTDGGVNFAALEKLINFHLQSQTDALIVCGTTGEPSTMTSNEKADVLKFVVRQVRGRIPVIAGTGGNNTARVVEDSINAQTLGADGLLLVTPYYNKCTQEGLVKHFAMVNQAVSIPMIVYNVPARTGLNLLPETLLRLCDLSQIVGVKEASANIEQITEMARLCGDRMDLYSGNDDHIVPVLALGGKGVISVLANVVPLQTHQLVAKFLAGDVAGSREMQFTLNPLVKALFTQVNPIPVKTALNLMGFGVGPLRLPLTEMSGTSLEALRTTLAQYGLLPKGDVQ